MTEAQSSAGGDGRLALRRAMRRADRTRRLKAVALVAPLFLFLLVAFVIPIVVMLFRSVDNPELGASLPRTSEAIAAWDSTGTPDEPVYAALAADLMAEREARALAEAAKRLNYEITGFRTLVYKSARRLARLEPAPASYKQALTAIDARWGERRYWAAVKRASPRYSPFYLLAAVDREVDADGAVVPTRPEQALYVDVFQRTFWMSAMVMVACLLLGFPVSYLLATLPTRISNLLMILVLLPFWTSLLVRTSAWVIVLQRQGFVNDAMIWLGLLSEPVQLVFNRTGVYLAMIHILLPFMVLPLYSVMKGISPAYMRAAASLGANPLVAFVRVYLPQTVPGVGAGCLLVFILAIGYYITPALLGGPKDQMVSYFIAFFTRTLNWGMASALGVILLVCTVALYVVYSRLVGIERMRLG